MMYAPILQTAATYYADGRTAVWRVPFPYRTPADVGVKLVDAEGLETVLDIGRDCMLHGFDLCMYVPEGKTVKIWLKAAVADVLPCMPSLPAAGAQEGDGGSGEGCCCGASALGPVYCPPHPGPWGCVPPPSPCSGQGAAGQTTEARYLADGHTARWQIPFAYQSPADVGVKLVDAENLERFLTMDTDYMVAGPYVCTFVPAGLTVVIWQKGEGAEQVPAPPPPGDACCAHLVPPPLDPAVAWLVRAACEVRTMQDRGVDEFQTRASEVLDDARASADAAAQSEENAAASAEAAETATHYLFNHGVLGYQTKALLDADLDHEANVLAFVTNDPTPANNNWYIKVGASGEGEWQASDFSPATTADVRAKADKLETGYALAKNSTVTILLSDRLTRLELREAELRAEARLEDIEAGAERMRESLGNPLSAAQIDEIMAREVTADD